MLAIGFIIGAVLGSLICYLLCQPKMETVQTLDDDIKKENIQLQVINNNLLEKQDDLLSSISKLKEQAEKSADEFLQLANAAAESQFELNLTKLSQKYKEAEKNYEKSYLALLETQAKDFSNWFTEKNQEIQKLDTTLQNMRSLAQAAVEANKRAAEMADQVNFYRIQVPAADLEEIQKLKNVLPYLRDKEALNKVIWKIYYEKPTSDLIGRVVGANIRTGIYKITNVNNGMCYIGQAVDIASRWKQHIKRGVGAESQTNNKLYPALLEHGVENFTFEIIEECERELLNERELYWQSYFGAKEFGYSIK